MSKAVFRKVSGKTGSGRFVVSEGNAPSTYLLPHEALPTAYKDSEDDRFEIVIPKGLILSVVKNSSDDSRLVPANGTQGVQAWGDLYINNPDIGATPTTVGGSTDTVNVIAASTPIGCAQYDLYRPFDKGTSQGGGWITRGFVEWPMVRGLNDNLLPGDLVRADSIGRPVKQPIGNTTAGDNGVSPHLTVGKVVEVEYFATNFDDGLLSYMQLPSDPGALKLAYQLAKAGPYSGKLGIRANLDVTNVVGAFRVNLNL